MCLGVYAPEAAPVELQIMIFGMLLHCVKRSSCGLFVIRLLLFGSWSKVDTLGTKRK